MKNPPQAVPEGMKHCFKCGTTRALAEFWSSPRRDRPGKQLRSACRVCSRAYYSTPEWKERFIVLQREARAKKRAFVTAQKVAVGCMDCGESHPACLEFHHRDPSEKKTEVVKLVDSNAGWKSIEAETAKCDVLCSNCHRKRHYNEREAAKSLAKEA